MNAKLLQIVQAINKDISASAALLFNAYGYLFAEVSEDGKLICPSSVAAYLNDLGYVLTACSPQSDSSRQYGVQLPSIETTPHQELLEWIGAMALGVNTR